MSTRLSLAALLAGLCLPVALSADALPVALPNAVPHLPAYNPGDAAFVLIASALVLLMTPGLAFFYGGMVRKKNVLSTMMHSFLMLAIISLAWVAIGYSGAYSPTGYFGDTFGDFSFAMLRGVDCGVDPRYATGIPHLLFMAFQMKFAIITVALISGAIAERVKFSAFLLFALLWALLVYTPVCRAIWGPHGFLKDMGLLDFAGGTVVHVLAGFSSLTAAVLLGNRRGLGEQNMLPHNTTMVMLGAGLLWFGWFGFNAGSALAANDTAIWAFVNTNTAAAAAMTTWIATEWWMNGRPTALGAASGCIVGLAAVTQAAGYITPAWAMALGAVASPICVWAVHMKGKLGYDDTLDAFGVHGVAGTVGALATGLLATRAINAAGADGLLYGGGWALLKVQALGAGLTALYAVVGTAVAFKLVDWTVGFRVSARDEELGLDLTQHSEAGYEI
jgi:Amt family ammonium transporter